MNKKRCSKCGLIKSVSEFYKNKSSRDGLDHYCRKCNSERMLIYFRTDKGKAALKKAAKKLMKKYWAEKHDRDR